MLTNPRDYAAWTVLWCTAAIITIAASSRIYGCATQSNMESAALFAAQLNLCVANASTRLEAEACRVNVEMVWCGPGGALASSAGCKDGGR